MARVTGNVHDLTELVTKMESDFWMVRHIIIGQLLADDPVIESALSGYDGDVNEFAWQHRVSPVIVGHVFRDGAERHTCPLCGHGMVVQRTAFDPEPEPKGYTRTGFERHLSGFGRQPQCSIMQALQIATHYCIEHEKKSPWKPRVKSSPGHSG